MNREELHFRRLSTTTRTYNEGRRVVTAWSEGLGSLSFDGQDGLLLHRGIVAKEFDASSEKSSSSHRARFIKEIPEVVVSSKLKEEQPNPVESRE